MAQADWDKAVAIDRDIEGVSLWSGLFHINFELLARSVCDAQNGISIRF